MKRTFQTLTSLLYLSLIHHIYIIGYVGTAADESWSPYKPTVDIVDHLSTCFARIYSFCIVLRVLLSGFPDTLSLPRPAHLDYGTAYKYCSRTRCAHLWSSGGKSHGVSEEVLSVSEAECSSPLDRVSWSLLRWSETSSQLRGLQYCYQSWVGHVLV